MRKAMAGAVVCVLGLTGCMGAPLRYGPSEPIVDTQVPIQQAEEAGAAQHPDAAQHLEWARQQTQGARRLIEQNRRDEAALFLKRAAADAELALVLAREAPARAEADQVLQQVRELQQTTVPAQ